MQSLFKELVPFLLLQWVSEFLHFYVEFVADLEFALDALAVFQHGVDDGVLLAARVPQRIA